MRNREDEVEITNGQKFALLALKPLLSGMRSTLGAMAVTTGVVRRPLKTAAVTPLQMSAESFGSANLNGVNNLKMSSRQLVTLAIGFAMETENIGEFPWRPEFGCPVECGRHRQPLSIRHFGRSDQQVELTGIGHEVMLAHFDVAHRRRHRRVAQ